MRVFILLVSVLFAQVTMAELRVGFSLPLTGDVAEYGVAAKNGAVLAMKEHEEEFRNIKVFYQDNKYNAKEALSAYKKLSKIDQVDIIYNWGETPLSSVAPIAEREKMPIVAMSYDYLASKNSKYIIRSTYHSQQFTDVLLNYLRKDPKYKTSKIGIIKTEDSYLNSLVLGLEAGLNSDEKIEIAANILPSDNDFRTLISKLKRKQYDLLGIYLFPGQVSNFYRAAVSQGYTLNTFGTDIFDSPVEIKSSNGGMEGVVFPDVYVSEEFLEKYNTEFGHTAHIPFAYNAYVFTKYITYLSKNLEKDKNSEKILGLLTVAPKHFDFPFEYQESKELGNYYKHPISIKKVIENKTEVIKVVN